MCVRENGTKSDGENGEHGDEPTGTSHVNPAKSGIKFDDIRSRRYREMGDRSMGVQRKSEVYTLPVPGKSNAATCLRVCPNAVGDDKQPSTAKPKTPIR
jgi:hypothetical protein